MPPHKEYDLWPAQIEAVRNLEQSLDANKPRALIPLRAWYAEVSNADWRTPADIKTTHRNASFLANNRVIFNIKGNNFPWK